MSDLTTFNSKQPGAAVISGTAPEVVRAAPALATIDRWRSQLVTLRRFSPHGDAALTLANCIDDMIASLVAGRDSVAPLTLTQASEESGRPISTLRWLAKNKPWAIGATRSGNGPYYLNRAQFERWKANPKKVEAEGPPTTETN